MAKNDQGIHQVCSFVSLEVVKAQLQPKHVIVFWTKQGRNRASQVFITLPFLGESSTYWKYVQQAQKHIFNSQEK